MSSSPNDPFENTPEDDAKLAASIASVKRPHGVKSFRRLPGSGSNLFAAGDPERTGQLPDKAKRQKQPDHSVRTRAYYEALGYLFTKTEWWTSSHDGYQWKRDLFGLFDAIAIKRGELIGIQISSKDGVAEHIRKMCKDEPVKSLNGTTRVGNLRRWLEEGAKVQVIGWHQPSGSGGRWTHTITQVTIETIELVLSRKRQK